MLLGCDLAPRYAPPSFTAPPAYKEALPGGVFWKKAQPSGSENRGEWWLMFKDTELNAYEERLSSANLDIQAAVASFFVARAIVKQSRAQYYPSLSMSPAVTNNYLAATPFGFFVNKSFDMYSLPFDAAWTPDFWSKTKNTVKMNIASAQASAANLQNIRLTMQGDLAVDYYQLRGQDALKAVLAETAEEDLEALRLDRALCKAGLASDQTVAQAEYAYEAARGQAENAGILRAQYEHAIAVLLGEPPSIFSIAVKPFRLPTIRVPALLPSDLLERRPDIAAAERAVAQANYQIGVQRAAYYPSFSLSGTAGYLAFAFQDWANWADRMWAFGGGFVETLFDAGLRKATLRQYKRSYRQVVANYRKTVLAAFQQVEDDMASLRISAKDILRQKAAVRAERRNLAEETVRYRAGLDSRLNVVMVRLTLLSLKQTDLNYETQYIAAGIQLIEALGGGWNRSSLPTPKDLGKWTREPPLIVPPSTPENGSSPKGGQQQPARR